MTNSTFPVNGGAMPKLERHAIMARAWAIFRQTYLYPQIKFSSIGRACFASCLRRAWAEVRDAARIAMIPAAVKAARIDALTDIIAFAPFGESWALARHEISSARAELDRLSA